MELLDIIGISVVTGVLSLGTFFICLRCCRSMLDVASDYKMASENVTLRRYLGSTIRQSFRGVRSSFRRVGSVKKDASKSEKSENENHGNISSQPSINEFWRERSIIHPSYLSKKSDSTVSPLRLLNSSQPMKHDHYQPLKHDISQPLKQNSSKPLKQDSSQPLKQDSSQPLKHDSSQPLKHDSSRPLKQDVLIIEKDVDNLDNIKDSAQFCQVDVSDNDGIMMYLDTVAAANNQDNEQKENTVSLERVIFADLVDFDQHSCSSGDTLILDGSMTPQLFNAKQLDGEYEEVGPPRFENNGSQQSTDKVQVAVSNKTTDKVIAMNERSGLVRCVLKFFSGKKTKDKSQKTGVSQDKTRNLKDDNLSSAAHPDPSEESLVSSNNNMKKTSSTNECFSKATSSVIITSDDWRQEGGRQKENTHYGVIKRIKIEENYLENVKNNASNINNGETKVQSLRISMEETGRSPESVNERQYPNDSRPINSVQDLGRPLSASGSKSQEPANKGNGTFKSRSSLRVLKAKRKRNDGHNACYSSGGKVSHTSQKISADPPQRQVIDNNEYEDVAPPVYCDIYKPPGGNEMKHTKSILRQIDEPTGHHQRHASRDESMNNVDITKDASNLMYEIQQKTVKTRSLSHYSPVDFRYQTAPLPSTSNDKNHVNHKWPMASSSGSSYYGQNQHRPAALPESGQRSSFNEVKSNYVNEDLDDFYQIHYGDITGQRSHHLEQRINIGDQIMPQKNQSYIAMHKKYLSSPQGVGKQLHLAQRYTPQEMQKQIDWCGNRPNQHCYDIQEQRNVLEPPNQNVMHLGQCGRTKWHTLPHKGQKCVVQGQKWQGQKQQTVPSKNWNKAMVRLTYL